MKKLLLYCLTGFLLFQSCGFYGRQRGPTDWHRIPKPDYTIPPQAQYIGGLKICLDPGHGGDNHIQNYKRGPTGLREAEINLRVALYLKEFLEKSGATVILTRDGDYEIDLKKRTEMANFNQADIFISLHHNAATNPQTNYASTWYHGDADFAPASLDLARYIQQSLVENLRLPQQLPTGLLSDYLMHPNGFGVLQNLNMPGVLLEISFFTNPQEEKLLSKPEYNRLEAYAIYLGIVRWAAAGIPKVVLIEPRPDTTIADKQPTIYLKIKDGLHERPGNWMLSREQYFSRQVTFFLDDSIAPFILDRDQNLIIHIPEKPLFNGWHTTYAEVVNYLGNHNLPHRDRFRIAPPAQFLFAKAWNDRLPADGKAFTGIDVLALDIDSLAVADEDTVSAISDYGKWNRQAAATSNGLATFFLQTDSLPGIATLKFSIGEAHTYLTVSFCDTNTTLIAGLCRNEKNSLPIENVLVTLMPDSVQQLTNADGIYYFPHAKPGDYTLNFLKNGYFSQNLEVVVNDGKSNIDTLKMRPIFNGVLHNFVLVLDPSFGGQESGVEISPNLNSAQANLQLAQILKTLFEQAGAEIYLTRDRDSTLSRDQRIKLSNQFPPGGYYLRLNLDCNHQAGRMFKGCHYVGNEEGKRLLQSMANRLTRDGFCDQIQIAGSAEPELVRTNRRALTLDLDLKPQDSLLISNEASLSRLAWGIFLGFVEELGGENLPTGALTINIRASHKPLADAEIFIGSSLRQLSNQTGAISYEYLKPGKYYLSISHPIYGKREEIFIIQNSSELLINLSE